MVNSDEKRVADEFWPKLAANLSRLPFAEDAIAAWYCAFDPATPLKVKGILIAALAYFIMPVDIVPDFIIGLGFTDDLAALVTAYTMVKGHVTPSHRDKARAKLASLRGQASA